jgi:hypothetical protein
MAPYKFLGFLVILLFTAGYSFGVGASKDNPFTETYTEYDILTIGSLEQAAGKKPFQIERAYRYIHPKSKMLPIERIQIRAPSGHIIAYTPTRMKAVTYCPRHKLLLGVYVEDRLSSPRLVQVQSRSQVVGA